MNDYNKISTLVITILVLILVSSLFANEEEEAFAADDPSILPPIPSSSNKDNNQATTTTATTKTTTTNNYAASKQISPNIKVQAIINSEFEKRCFDDYTQEISDRLSGNQKLDKFILIKKDCGQQKADLGRLPQIPNPSSSSPTSGLLSSSLPTDPTAPTSTTPNPNLRENCKKEGGTWSITTSTCISQGLFPKDSVLLGSVPEQVDFSKCMFMHEFFGDYIYNCPDIGEVNGPPPEDLLGKQASTGTLQTASNSQPTKIPILSCHTINVKSCGPMPITEDPPLDAQTIIDILSAVGRTLQGGQGVAQCVAGAAICIGGGGPVVVAGGAAILARGLDNLIAAIKNQDTVVGAAASKFAKWYGEPDYGQRLASLIANAGADFGTGLLTGALRSAPVPPGTMGAADDLTGTGGTQSSGSTQGAVDDLAGSGSGGTKSSGSTQVAVDDLAGTGVANPPTQKLLPPGGGKIIPNKLEKHELEFANDIVSNRGGELIGNLKKKQEGIEGFLNGQPISLKETDGGLVAILKHASKAEKQAKNAGYSNVEVFIKATSPQIGKKELLEFAHKGGLIQIPNQGTVSAINVLTNDGWTRIIPSPPPLTLPHPPPIVR
jgi:hypothetical protein